MLRPSGGAVAVTLAVVLVALLPWRFGGTGGQQANPSSSRSPLTAAASTRAQIAETLEGTPPQLAADIAERGIILAGGGALRRGLPEHLQATTGLPVRLVDYPLVCVAVRAGRCLDQLDALERSARNPDRTARRAVLR